MRFTAFGAGVLLSFVIFSADTRTVAAQSVAVATLEPNSQTADKLAVLEMVQEKAEPQPAPAPPEPPKHVVENGETLSLIAAKHQTTWVRIYAKNAQIENPDIVNPGVELQIPLADEQLPERTLPVVEVAPQPVLRAKANKPASKPATANAASVSRGSSSGNTYGYGYCTWYVKNRRPDLPNNLGNADTWVSRAAAQGLPTGSSPQAGAVGQRGMHVVYVESLNADGTINISEMNRAGWNVTSSRTVPANYFQYIY